MNYTIYNMLRQSCAVANQLEQKANHGNRQTVALDTAASFWTRATRLLQWADHNQEVVKLDLGPRCR